MQSNLNENENILLSNQGNNIVFNKLNVKFYFIIFLIILIIFMFHFWC